MASSSSRGRWLVRLKEMSENEMLTIVTERFERRLAEEIAGLRIEMHTGFAALRKEMSDQRAELLKWSLLFWVGQFAAFTAVLSFLLRMR
jgi:hypothetical protein